MGEENSEKSALVPRLRFPEFREAEQWQSRSLKDSLSSISNGLALEQANRTSGYRVTRIETIAAGTIDLAKVGLIETSEDISAYRLRVGDILLSNINSVAHIGKSVFVDRDYDLYHGMNLLRLEVDKNQHDPKFIFYAINTEKIRASLRERANKAVNQASINQTELGKTEVALPLIPEQQKVADCLSSLDELIAAETQALAALKTYKKGLMQQLFPREGETVPRLRFPEFREAGEWEVKRLGEVGNMRMCKRILKEQTSPQGDIPFYKIGTFGGIPDAYISREVFESFRSSYPFPKKGAVLISAAGTIGRTVRYDGELAYFQDSNIVWLENDEDLIADGFLLHSYQLINWAPSVGAIQRLYNENILAAQVKFPSIPEQQRIADCLSSLDDLITAQSQKIDALKAHKKGLMQQLFPVLDEVPA